MISPKYIRCSVVQYKAKRLVSFLLQLALASGNIFQWDTLAFLKHLLLYIMSCVK